MRVIQTTKAGRVTKMRLGDIVKDPDYQVRKTLNSQYVAAYADAMRAGSVFPPLVIDAKTKKMICGFTRLEAYWKVMNPDYMVPVILMSFKNEAERILFAAEDNAKHGQPLNSFDVKNIIARLKPYKIEVDEIARRLSMSHMKVERLAGELVVVVGTKPKFVPTEIRSANKGKATGTIRMEMPLKAGVKHLAGKVLPVSTYRNIENHYLPNAETMLVNQIIMRLADNTLDITNDLLMSRLRVLHEKLGKFLEKHGEED